MAEELESTQQPQENNYLNAWSDPNAIKVPYTYEDYALNPYEERAVRENLPYSNWETFKNSAKLMWDDTTLGVLGRWSDVEEGKRTTDDSYRPIYNPILSREEANLKYQKYGVTFNKPVRQNEAEVIAAQKIKEVAQRQRLQQNEGTFMSGAASLLGGFAGSMLDPINIATAFIPVTKIVPALKGLEAMGFWGKVALKGMDGMIMNSLVEPMPVWMADIDQRDYTMADSLFNIVAGGVFGAGIGGFTEGVRMLTNGEKFNSNLASAIDLGNNRGLDNITEFQKKNPAVTSMTYDSLVYRPDESLHITTEGKTTMVKLAEEGPLSEITGRGSNLAEAKMDLGQKIGYALRNEDIFVGYRIDDAIDNLYKALNEAGMLSNSKWLPKWLATMNSKALKKGMSLQDYIAANSNNFTEFSKIIKRAEQSRKMQVMFENLTGESLDDAIENAAELIDAMSEIKEAFKRNPRHTLDMETYINTLREKEFARKEKAELFSEREGEVEKLKELRKELQKQLDAGEVTIEGEDIASRIKDLDASIKAHEADIANIHREHWDVFDKTGADDIKILEAIRNRLNEDPRGFEDVKEQLMKQTEEMKTWNITKKEEWILQFLII